MNLQEIERLAFLKYKLSKSKKSMNTFIFTQAKNNKLTDSQIKKLLENLDKRITKEKEAEKQKELAKIEKLNFTCNLF